MRPEPVLAKVLRWAVWVTAAIVPLIIFSQYMSPFHFGKVVVFRSVVELMLACYLVLIWQDRSYRPKLDAIGWTFLAFSLVFTLTTLTSVSHYMSFWGTLERMGGLFTFWHYFVFFVMTCAVLRERRHWHTLMELMIVSGFLSAIYGFLQKTDWTFILGSGGRQRPFGTIGNPALFSGYQILCAFAAGTLAFRSGLGDGHRWWLRIASAFMFLAAFSTAVRGSLIGIVAGIFVAVLLYGTLYRSKRAKMGLLWISVAAILFFFASQLFHNSNFVKSSPYLTRVTDFSSQTRTVQTRMWTWTSGLKGWMDSPKNIVLGWGPENFNVPFSKYFDPRHFNGPGAETFFDRAHNNFIEVLVTMGLVGEAAYLAFFVAVFMACWALMKRTGDDRMIGIGWASMTVAYLIHNSFIFDTSANYVTYFALAGFLVYLKSQPAPGTQAPKLASGRAASFGVGHLIALVALLIAAITLLVRVNVRPSMANFATTRAIVAGWQGQFPQAMDSYEKAVTYNTFGVYEERHRMAQYLLEVAPQVEGEALPEPFVKAMEFAMAEVEKNTQMNKLDYLPLLYLARMHVILGKSDAASPHNDAALDLTRRALEISPTFVRTYYEVAQAYLNKQQPVEAYNWFDKARQLQPEVGITYWYMGVVRAQLAGAAKSADDMKAALDLMYMALEKGYGPSPQDAERMAQAHLALGDLAGIAVLYEKLVKISPREPQFWEQLIAVRTELNDTAAAIETITRALAQPGVGDNEEFKAKAQTVLNALASPSQGL